MILRSKHNPMEVTYSLSLQGILLPWPMAIHASDAGILVGISTHECSLLFRLRCSTCSRVVIHTIFTVSGIRTAWIEEVLITVHVVLAAVHSSLGLLKKERNKEDVLLASSLASVLMNAVCSSGCDAPPVAGWSFIPFSQSLAFAQHGLKKCWSQIWKLQGKGKKKRKKKQLDFNVLSTTRSHLRMIRFCHNGMHNSKLFSCVIPV